ncbi:porin [Halomonas alkalicola]|uniref:Porin n=1 Tax=Halomonas alkalicola TaxID=1930622 RepID=A0ABY9H388_9GAMM|nr:porin [Halomonas alkalicola]WLI72935.1 porin [Halomonas alkalicola]
MKKTLLATAIAGALGVSAAAQAATVYDQDGTQIDIYGRINFAVTAGGVDDAKFDGFDADGNPVLVQTEKTSGSEFRDVNSRIGFRARHQLSSDLQAFGNVELRPRMDAVNDDGITVRNTFVGLNSNQFGMVRVGNFDSVFYSAVTSMFDVPEWGGYTTLDGGSISSRGDSVQYSTPNLEGFQAHVSVKHLSGNGQDIGEQDNSSTVSAAGAVSYEIDGLYLAAGYNQSKGVSRKTDRGASYDGGAAYAGGEDIWGVSARYAFTPALSARLTYQEVASQFDQATLEEQKNPHRLIENLWGLGATFDYGMGEVYADYYRVRMALDQIDSQNRWNVGVNYRFSEPMYVYAEIWDTDFDTDDSVSDLNDDLGYAVGIRYDF